MGVAGWVVYKGKGIEIANYSSSFERVWSVEALARIRELLLHSGNGRRWYWRYLPLIEFDIVWLLLILPQELILTLIR